MLCSGLHRPPWLSNGPDPRPSPVRRRAGRRCLAHRTYRGRFHDNRRILKVSRGRPHRPLGRRRVLLLGAAFFAFPSFLYLLIDEPYTLLGLRFVHGAATAIFSPVAAAAVSDLFQESRGEKLGWFANEMGSAFGPDRSSPLFAVG